MRSRSDNKFANWRRLYRDRVMGYQHRPTFPVAHVGIIEHLNGKDEPPFLFFGERRVFDPRS